MDKWGIDDYGSAARKEFIDKYCSTCKSILKQQVGRCNPRTKARMSVYQDEMPNDEWFCENFDEKEWDNKENE